MLFAVKIDFCDGLFSSMDGGFQYCLSARLTFHGAHKYNRLSLSRSRRDPLKHFEITVLRHIRFAELRKIPIKQANFTNEHVI